MVLNPWVPKKPHPGPQQQFLLHAHTLEVGFGGAAGGGKSAALLMAAAQYADVPGYSALLIRKTFKDLRQADALIPQSKELWHGTGAKWNDTDSRWTFPSGATVAFGYVDHKDDVLQYQGSAFQFIGLDEATQHDDGPYRYLFTRLRKRTSGGQANVPLRMRSTANPGGKGHGWYKARLVNPVTRLPGAVFVKSKLEDNPSLNREDYDRSLKNASPADYARLRFGDWTDPEGGRFKKDWWKDNRYGRQGDYFTIGGKRVHLRELQVYFTVDPAASAKKTADYTVISVWGLTRWGHLLWLDCVRVQREIPDIVPLLQGLARKWKPVVVGIEAVASNAGVLQLAQRAEGPRLNTRALDPAGQDKLVHATGAINFAFTRKLWVPEREANPAFPIDEVETELVLFTGLPGEDAHDDIVDTLSYAVDALAWIPNRNGGAPQAFGGI